MVAGNQEVLPGAWRVAAGQLARLGERVRQSRMFALDAWEKGGVRGREEWTSDTRRVWARAGRGAGRARCLGDTQTTRLRLGHGRVTVAMAGRGACV